METSNLISLGALIVALIALIPSYYQAFYQSKKANIENKNSSSSGKEETLHKNLVSKVNDNEINLTHGKSVKEEDKPTPPMIRILVLTLTGVIIGLIELILFSGVAYLFDVKVDLSIMPLIWTIAFFSLFIIPCVFFWFAFMTFTTMFSD